MFDAIKLPAAPLLDVCDLIVLMPLQVADIETMARALHLEEQVRAARFVSEDARRLHIAAHWLKGQVLGHFSGSDIALLRYGSNPYGKPHLLGMAGRLAFNLTHGGSWVAVMVSRRHEVGVNVETPLREQSLDDLRTFTFHPLEREALGHNAASPDVLYRYWALKEAAVKAMGIGLNQPFDRLYLAAQGEACYCLVDGTGGLWALGHRMLPDGAQLAFCAAGNGCPTRLLEVGCDGVARPGAAWYEERQAV